MGDGENGPQKGLRQGIPLTYGHASTATLLLLRTKMEPWTPEPRPQTEALSVHTERFVCPRAAPVDERT